MPNSQHIFRIPLNGAISVSLLETTSSAPIFVPAPKTPIGSNGRHNLGLNELSDFFVFMKHRFGVRRFE